MRVPNCTLMLLLAITPALALSQESPGEPDPNTLLEAADSVLHQVERLRGIASTGPIDEAVVARDALRAMLVEEIDEQLSDAQVASIDRMLTALGVLRDEQDYLTLMLDLLQEQIAGFYDDGEDVFYILDDMAMELQLPVMAHELFHAVQDQVFDLQRLKARSDVITDIAIGRTALVEGDALAAMLLYSTGGALALDQIPMIDSIASTMPSAAEGSEVDVPELIWQQLTFPYTGGLSFVLHLYRHGGWDAVNAAYLAPPQSAEQVLHPERYLAGDAPTWLEYDASVGGARRYMSDIFGEFTLRGLLEQIAGAHLSDAAIARAVDGWDGDRLDAWVFDDDPGRDRITMMSVWDTPAEALQFADSAERLALGWGAGALPAEVRAGPGGRRRLASGEGLAVLVDLRGDLVVIVLDRGGSPAQRDLDVFEVADAMWTSYARFAYPDAAWEPAP